MKRIALRAAGCAGILAVALSLASCGGPSRKEITDSRPVPEKLREAPPRLSELERLRLRDFEHKPAGDASAMPSGMEMTGGTPAPASPHGQMPAPFVWIAPEGWTETEARPMRLVTFSAAGGSIECYVSLLGGAAGGVAANVNRWRSQMGVPELDAAAIEALPTISMLGAQARLADIEGDYMGMDGAPKTGYRMLGTVCSLDDQAVFVKMIGPKDAVAAEKERFLAFCGSLSKGGN